MFRSMHVAINEKRLEAEVPVKVMNFSASVDVYFFFPHGRAPGKKCFCLYIIFFRFCFFVITSFVYRHTIPRAHYNVHAIMLTFLNYNIRSALFDPFLQRDRKA